MLGWGPHIAGIFCCEFALLKTSVVFCSFCSRDSIFCLVKLILCDLGSPLEGDGERSLRSTPHELRRSPTTEMGVQAGRGGNRWVFVFLAMGSSSLQGVLINMG